MSCKASCNNCTPVLDSTYLILKMHVARNPPVPIVKVDSEMSFLYKLTDSVPIVFFIFVKWFEYGVGMLIDLEVAASYASCNVLIVY